MQYSTLLPEVSKMLQAKADVRAAAAPAATTGKPGAAKTAAAPAGGAKKGAKEPTPGILFSLLLSFFVFDRWIR